MSMLRNVLTYMGLGPDEDYDDDGYPYDPDEDHDDRGAEARESGRKGRSPGRRSGPDIDLTDGARHTAPSSKPDRRGGSSPATAGPSSADRTAADRSPSNRSTGERAPGERRSSGPASSQRRAASRPRSDETQPGDGPRRRGRHDLDEPAPSRPLRAVPPADLDDGGGSGITIRPVPPLPDQPSKAPGPVYVKPHPLSPRSFGDAKTLADEFKNGVPVIMNLQGVERDLARRLIDFASGICYALDGGMEKIAPQVFLLTPAAVEVSDEERRRLGERDFQR